MGVPIGETYLVAQSDVTHMMISRNPASGLVYVIAACGSARPPGALRAVAERLRTAARAVGPGETRDLPGILWGFEPHGAGEEPPGDRLSHDVRGRLEAVLRGDPVWLEPLSSQPCDARELVSEWEQRGAGTAPLLDNLSLALVADAQAQTLTLVTDRMGGISLYTAEVEGARVYSTSYIALSRILERKEIDGESLACFFHLGYFPGRRTALRAVSLVPFATVTVLHGGEASTRSYWRPDMAVDRGAPLHQQLDNAVEAFNTTVREYSAGRSKMCLAMTAGLDSRSVASSLICQRIPFETYTHGFPDCWEGRRVASIVQRHQIPHRFVPLVESFTDRLSDLARESFQATEGTISCIEKSHLLHVQAELRRELGPDTGLLLGGGAGMLKGTFYRLIHDAPMRSDGGIDAYLTWNFTKKLPSIFASEVPATSRDPLRRFVAESLEEAGGGTFFQRLDYLYAVRYRRWAGGVKHIYRRFFPVREPFVSARLLDCLFRMDPQAKKAQLPHFRILAKNYPEIQYDLTNRMTPAMPFTWRTWPRFLPSIGWKAKQLLRGFSRRFLSRELFPLVDYVDYKTWIALPGGRRLVEELLDPAQMRSAHLYDRPKLEAWLSDERARSYASFPLIDKMCTLELYFREIEAT